MRMLMTLYTTDGRVHDRTTSETLTIYAFG
jgi:hypothetical protein